MAGRAPSSNVMKVMTKCSHKCSNYASRFAAGIHLDLVVLGYVSSKTKERVGSHRVGHKR